MIGSVDNMKSVRLAQIFCPIYFDAVLARLYAHPQRRKSMEIKILELLRSVGGSSISGEEIAKKIGVSRTAVWKHIHARSEEHTSELQSR